MEVMMGGSQYQYILKKKQLNSDSKNSHEYKTYRNKVLTVPTIGAGYQDSVHMSIEYNATRKTRQVSIRRLRDLILFS